MKIFIGVSICLMLSAIAVHASSRFSEYEYYHRGVFISVDFTAGMAFNERIAGRERNSSNGADIAVGYRFSPHWAVALGSGAHGYSNRTWTCGNTVPREVENTCVPIFVRLRNDMMDREVSPYLQMDMGYSFMEMYTREDAGRVKYSQDRFTNGRYEYMEMDDSYIQYGNAGWFTALDLGISLHVIGRCRMNIGLSAGVHQAFLGTSFLTTEGEVINFGRTDYLCDGTGESPAIVRTAGSPDFWDSLDSSLKVKIGFTF